VLLICLEARWGEMVREEVVLPEESGVMEAVNYMTFRMLQSLK
jgi:hypothetical protein